MLDLASLVPPLLLDARAGSHVLDMCAAPGGKSLALAIAMWGSGWDGTQEDGKQLSGRLHVNDKAQAR